MKFRLWIAVLRHSSRQMVERCCLDLSAMSQTTKHPISVVPIHVVAPNRLGLPYIQVLLTAVSRRRRSAVGQHRHSGSVFLPMMLVCCADVSIPFTPHIPINTPKVNNFRQQTGALRRRMEMEGGAKRDRNIHRYSEGIEGAAGMPERPSWLSFGLPGSGPGATKCAHLCCLGWSLIGCDRS